MKSWVLAAVLDVVLMSPASAEELDLRGSDPLGGRGEAIDLRPFDPMTGSGDSAPARPERPHASGPGTTIEDPLGGGEGSRTVGDLRGADTLGSGAGSR